MHFKKARRLAIHAVKILLLAAMSAATRGLCQDSTNAPASNGQDPLLDLLIQKGILTQQEADRVEAEAQARRTNNPAQMPSMPGPQLAISKAFKHMELFGDARLRYEDRSAKDVAGNEIDLQRFRYAIRFGLRGDLFDQFYFGLRLDTSPNPRSDFVTFGTATASSSSYYYGPFGKQNAGVNIGEVYLGWHPESWVDVTVGKMPNPLFTSTMVWNSTITPEGFAEHFKYPVGPAQFYATFGQFLYEDLNPNFASGGLGINGIIGQHTDNIFMFAWQGGVKYQITPKVKAEVAATIYNYIGLKRSTVNTISGLAPYYGDPYVGEGDYVLDGGGRPGSTVAPGSSGFGTGVSLGGYGSLNYPFNQVGLDNLQVVEIPFELEFRIPANMEARVFGDFAYNLEGKQRAEAAAAAYDAVIADNPLGLSTPPSGKLNPQTSDVKAYQIGVGIGSDDLTYGPMQGLVYGTSSPRHAWEVRTYWQHIEQYSLDPNILDLDFFNGLENLQGVYVAAAYAFTDNVIGTFRYGHASRINDALGTGGSSLDIPQINPVNSFDIYQVDLTLRF